MKKLLTVLLFAALVTACFSGFAQAEELSLESMDFESLVELKTAVDAEVNSRPEAQKFELYPGNYTVGEDIKAGRYYAMMDHPQNSYAGYPKISVYQSKKSYDEKNNEILYRSCEYGESPIVIDLEEGNYVKITDERLAMKATEFTEDDYYRYVAPEGTYVAAGVYYVGENGDIPAGSYDIYTATENTIKAGYYFNKEQYEAREDAVYSSIKAGDKMSMRLEEGYIFIISGGDAIMKKSAKLIFD